MVQVLRQPVVAHIEGKGAWGGASAAVPLGEMGDFADSGPLKCHTRSTVYYAHSIEDSIVTSSSQSSNPWEPVSIAHSGDTLQACFLRHSVGGGGAMFS